MQSRPPRPRRWTTLSALGLATAALGAVVGTAAVAAPPLGLTEVLHPKDNPTTPEKVALGKQLFFDPRLSIDNTISCASCHDPKHGFASDSPVGVGVTGLKGNRNSPTIINSAYAPFQFWDGRAKTLEEQALGPIANPVEMNLALAVATERLNKVEGYRTQFQKVFGTDVTPENIARAIAAFERTIISGNAPYDRFKAGDKTAMSEEAQRGMKLFFGKANCSACHSGPHFTDHAFHNIGLKGDDEGRFALSKIAGDRGAFKTSTLREIARSGPYMHDGSLKTLEDVVQHYNKGGEKGEYVDEEIFPLNLSDQEVADIVTFMKEGLASPDYPDCDCPDLPK